VAARIAAARHERARIAHGAEGARWLGPRP